MCRLPLILIVPWFVVGLFNQICTAETSATFAFQPVVKGQQISQQVSIRTDVTTTFEQSNQIISSTDRNLVYNQLRRIIVWEAGLPDSQNVKVQVSYPKAEYRTDTNPLNTKTLSQPVANKSYMVSRVDGRLQVTDMQGNEPPADELAIVRANMQWVGQPNPLAQFLNGRTVRIGERLELPKHVALDLMGSIDGFGHAHRVTLMLRQLRTISGRPCGVFDAKLLGKSASDDAQNVTLDGEITVELTTCRTLAIKMESLIDFNEERGPNGATFTVSNRGTARIAIQATYEKPSRLRSF